MSERIVFGAPYWDDDMVASVMESIRSGWWQSGPKTLRLESMIAEMTGAKHVIAVSSGTAGLHLILWNLIGAAVDLFGMTPAIKSDVITSPVSWASVPGAIKMAFGKPVFADVDPSTGNLDPESVVAALTMNTEAILPVHLAGHPCDMDKLCHISERYGIPIIEDATHAFLARWHGKACGTIGFAGVYSFNRAKNFAAAEGGAVVTENDAFARLIRAQVNGGVDRSAWERFESGGSYRVVSPGLNYKMPDLMAAMILPQLEKVAALSDQRAQVWKIYDAAFAGTPVEAPPSGDSTLEHARHLYQVKLPVGVDRDLLRAKLSGLGIGTGVHYNSLSLEPYYKVAGTCGHAEEFGRRTLSLPLSARVTIEDAKRVARTLLETLSGR